MSVVIKMKADSPRHILSLIPVKNQLWLMLLFFAPIIIWKRIETGVSPGQVVFAYCLMVYAFFQTLRSVAGIRNRILSREVPHHEVAKLTQAPIAIWRVMTILGLAYVAWESLSMG